MVETQKMTMERYGNVLEMILVSLPVLCRISSTEKAFHEILKLIQKVCRVYSDDREAVCGFLAIRDDSDHHKVVAETSKFCGERSWGKVKNLFDSMEGATIESVKVVDQNSLVIPLAIDGEVEAVVYMESVPVTDRNIMKLLEITRNQCSIVLHHLEYYRRMEKANKESKIKSHFLGMAAHELKNPLGLIMTYNKVLTNTLGSRASEEELSILKESKKATLEALEMVESLLDVSMIESGQLELNIEKSSLSLVILRSVQYNQDHANSKNIKLRTDIQEDFPSIPIDFQKIQQVVSNLISNAIKFSKPGTEIIVKLSKAGDNLAGISIIDQGVGIEEKYMDRLFLPFEKTKSLPTAGESSAGLGLTICEKIVEAHNGTIRVESEVGVGSSFHVMIPATSPEKE